jgi:hypothetical protein
MSALMCTRKNILVVATFAVGDEETLLRRLREREEVELMRAINYAARGLHAANVASLVCLYGDRRELTLDTPEMVFPDVSVFRKHEGARRLTPAGELLLREVREVIALPLATRFKACEFYHYQACEPTDYTKQSWFAEYTRALANLAQAVPGFDEAPWGI